MKPKKIIIHTEEELVLGDRAYSHGTYEFEMTPQQRRAVESNSGT
jgi:hypothetical protein